MFHADCGHSGQQIGPDDVCYNPGKVFFVVGLLFDQHMLCSDHKRPADE
jgi:hypothetical protein